MICICLCSPACKILCKTCSTTTTLLRQTYMLQQAASGSALIVLTCLYLVAAATYYLNLCWWCLSRAFKGKFVVDSCCTSEYFPISSHTTHEPGANRVFFNMRKSHILKLAAYWCLHACVAHRMKKHSGELSHQRSSTYNPMRPFDVTLLKLSRKPTCQLKA